MTLVVALILLMMGSAFFSATETAFSSLNKPRLKNMAAEGNKKAKLAYKLAENYDELISSTLVGNNVVNIAATTIGTLLFVGWLGSNGATVSTIFMTVITLVFGEITPKSLAKECPEKFAITVAPIINILITVLKPVNFLLIKLKSSVGKLLKVSGTTNGITENELLTIVDEAEQVGGLDSNESELIHNVIEFNDLQAGDIITPRVDVTAVDITTPNEEIADVFKTSGYSRIPVYKDTIDDIIGILYEKDFHNYVAGTTKSIETIMKPAEFIPPTVKISELLKKFQQTKLHIAVVVDEFGGTEGIVTMENILEELVGDIWDEHDEVEAGIKKLDDGSFIVPEDMDLDDFFEQFSINTETEASTINGWITEQIGKIPEVGDSFDFENPVSEEEDSEKDKENQNNKPQKLHIEVEGPRIVYLVETRLEKDSSGMELLRSLFSSQNGDYITAVDEKNIILIKAVERDASPESLELIANTIVDMMNSEAMLKVRVSYGTVVQELREVSKSYKEATMAMDVGRIFYAERNVIAYSTLGIGRLIYQLPVNLCRIFIEEIFGGNQVYDLDEETLTTINKFFENNLNVSETSRQLFIHRNTLVYRIEKLQKATGLDIRTFEDAMTFKIAMMVVNYMKYLDTLEY